MPVKQDDIKNWENRCIDLIRKATTKNGIKASCADVSNYSSIFTRDAVMTGIAGLLYKDQIIIEGLCATIENLHKLKGAQGQIASNFKINDDEITHVSFGTLSPKFDSATWYLIAVGLLNKHGYNFGVEYVADTIEMLDAIEYNGKHLLYVPTGGNWADEYPYEGYILYDQVLRSWALDILGDCFSNPDWTKKSGLINEQIQDKYYNKETKHYNCTFTPSEINTTFDFAAHCLLGMRDISAECDDYDEANQWMYDTFLGQGKLPGAFYPVIFENDKAWDKMKSFHLFDFKNKPHHYHNGGIWFVWLGWYALALARQSNEQSLNLLAETAFNLLSSFDEFNFEEYITSDTHQLSGTPELCYTATGILFLCKSLDKSVNPIDLIENKVGN